jgi:hypothetical protein
VLRALDVVVPLAVLGALLAITRAEGGRAGAVVLAGGWVLLTQVLPGAVLWRLLRRGDGSWALDLALGAGLGIVLAGLLGAAGGRLQQGWLPLLLPAAVVVLLLVPRSRRAWRGRPTSALPPPGWAAAVAATGVTLLAAYADFAERNPVRWVGWMRHFIDGPYHLAMAAEVLHHGPQDYSWVAGTPMQYPWLFYGWDASMGHLPGVPLDVVLFRASPVILLTLLPFVAAAAAWQLSGRAWAGPVAAPLAVAVGSLGLGTEAAVSPVVLDSPPQQLGMVVLATTIALLAARWRSRAAAWSVAALVVLLVGLFLSKGGPYPVLLAGMGLAAAVWLLASRAREQRVVLLDTVLAVVVFLVGFAVLLGGSASDLAPDPLAGIVRILTGEVGTVVAGTTLAMATIGFAVSRLAGTTAALLLLEGDRRGDLVRWVVLGAPVAGLGAALLLYQSGMSQLYFLIAGVFVGALGAAWGIAAAWERPRGRRVVGWGAAAGALAWACQYAVARGLPEQIDPEQLAQRWALLVAVVVVVALVVVAAALLRGRTTTADVARALAIALTAAAAVSVLPRVVAPGFPAVKPAVPGSSSAWSQANVAAAAFLRRASRPDDVVMTNRHCNSLPRPDCDRRAFVISAYSQRRVLVEGWAYTPEAIVAAAAATPPTSPFTGPFWDPARLELNDGFLARPSAQAARRLWEQGVRWVYVDRVAGSTGDLAPYARKVFSNEEATVYRMLDPDR